MLCRNKLISFFFSSPVWISFERERTLLFHSTSFQRNKPIFTYGKSGSRPTNFSSHSSPPFFLSPPWTRKIHSKVNFIWMKSLLSFLTIRNFAAEKGRYTGYMLSVKRKQFSRRLEKKMIVLLFLEMCVLCFLFIIKTANDTFPPFKLHSLQKKTSLKTGG